MAALPAARAILASARRPVVFTGAGISAESGVPTFRGHAADALWGKYDPMQLASPQGFARDPKLVYDWYTWRRTQLANLHPNPAHRAIAALQQRNPNTVVITQNVDGLHERVTPDPDAILRLHGTLTQDRCSICNHTETIDFTAPPPLRPCPACDAPLRPAVVWFGEPLDPETWRRAERAVEHCDALLVVGTSGTVYPAAGLVTRRRPNVPLIIVNLEPGDLDAGATHTFHTQAGETLPQLLSPAT